MPTKPTKVKFSSISLSSVFFLTAIAKTRNVSSHMLRFAFSNIFLCLFVNATISPLIIMLLHRLSMLSKAPLDSTQLSPSTRLTVLIIFLLLSNGISSTRIFFLVNSRICTPFSDKYSASATSELFPIKPSALTNTLLHNPIV